MKRKIPSLWKATFKTTSRRWKLESAVWSRLYDCLWRSHGGEKKVVERNTIVECCSCRREPSERRIRKSQTLLYTRLEQPPELITFGIDVECIEFLLHLVGDSAKESCQHTVLLDTSNFDGHDSRGKEKETGARGWAMLLTLCKLRHNFSQEALAMRFGVNQSTMSRFNIQLLGEHFGSMD